MPKVAALRIALIIACAWPAVCPPRPAQAEPENPVVFVGLRPASGSGYKSTEIRRLAEAQRVRATAEKVTRELTGRNVLNHAALRAALGSGYLVDFVDCRGEVKCVSAALGKLRGRTPLAVYGDYSVEHGRYRVRMRVIDIAAVKLLAEVEFSLGANQLEDEKRWNRELSVLFSAVEGFTPPPKEGSGEQTPPEGGETPPPEGEGPKEGGGDSGAKEGGAPASGDGEAAEPTGGGHDTDELTDADFGVTAAPSVGSAAEPVAGRSDQPIAEVSAGVSMLERRFRYDAEEGVDMAEPGFRSAWTSKLAGSLAVYPFALLGGGRLASLGLRADFGQTLSSGTGPSKVRDKRLYVGLAYRIAIGSNTSLPTFHIAAGYLRQDTTVLDTSIVFPDTSYRGAAIGGDVHMPILTPRVAINGGLRYLLISEAGEIVGTTYYGRSKVAGVDLDASLEVRPLERMFVRIGGSFTAIDFELGDNGDRSNLGAVAAQDRFMTGTVTTGFVL